MHPQHTLPLTSILVEDRQRKDLGDVQALANSIRENGLIQPVVVNQANRLIAGGRRLAACTLLGWAQIPVVYRETLGERELTILELEENIRRKDMTWQEEVLSVYKVHVLQTEKAILDGDSWTLNRTAEMLGMSRANVGFMVQVSKELRRVPQTAIWSCEGFWDALRFLARRSEDEINAELARRTTALMATNATMFPSSNPFKEPSDVSVEIIEPVGDAQSGQQTIPLSKQVILADCRDWLRQCPPEVADHCITDPPYGIDMDMLDQQNPHGGMQNVDRVRETHQVDENLVLLKEVIPLIHRALKPKGFFILWCDVMNWQFLYDHVIAADFKVQRWPLVWSKTSQCMNQSAQYNFTKNYEIAMVCRKQGATLVTDQQSSIFACQRDSYKSNPFAKPEALWDWLIKAVTIQGQTILEPFAGEGSAVNAIISNWRFPIAIEKDPQHFNVMLDEVKKKYDLMYRKPIYV